VELIAHAYIKSKLEEYDIDVEIVDVIVSGSRCKGLEQEGSDLDAVVEYRGTEHEDDLFNAFNEDGLAELLDKLPEIEVRGSLERRQASTLAIQIDQLSYDYDTYQYRDTVEDREAQIANIMEDIRSGNTGYLHDFLHAIISDGVREGIEDMFGKGMDTDNREAIQTVRKAQGLLDKLNLWQRWRSLKKVIITWSIMC
jgi:predicted nucleotidyltransferase